MADHKRFTNLLDAVAADPAGLGPLVGENATLGPCVGADNKSPTVLGPCVGDDVINPIRDLTTLGPSVGDDGRPPAA
jgi:hypothetical protein